MKTEPTFLGIGVEFCDPIRSAAAILPVPYDRTSTWKKGADRGPAAIIEASTQVELYDIETGAEVYQKGIATLPPFEFDGSPEELAERVESRVAEILDREQLPIVLGGEHSVSIGAIYACAKRFENLSVLQIDAHADTREEYEGSRFNHACVMARAREMCRIVQVGIRAVDAGEMENLDRSRVFFAHEIARSAADAWMDRVVDLLTQNVYVTIDVDGFDPSVIPATGTPEPGGLSWHQVNELLRGVIERRSVRGFDVVELLPMEGHHASAFTAAKLVYRILSMILAT